MCREVNSGLEATPPTGTGQSGFDCLSDFGGPESVSSELKRNDRNRESLYQFDALQRGLAPYFVWRRRLQDERILAFGFQYYALYRNADSTVADEDEDDFGGIFRFQENWTLFERDDRSLDRIEWRLESRSNLGGLRAPGSLGSATGIAALAPGFAYSDEFDIDLAIFNWTRRFNNGRSGFAIRRLGFDVYLDAFPFQTFSRGFANRSFILKPMLPTTGSDAIGAMAKGYVTDNVRLGALIDDANAASGDNDTLEQGEFVKAIEFGYTPGFEQRNTYRIQFTYWKTDARELVGVSLGKGWAVSAAYKLNDGLLPFVGFGHSDGCGSVTAQDTISMGLEATLRLDQVWTLGAGWAKPSRDTFGRGVDDETVLETSYKFRLSQNLSLTPDVQVIFNPANNPSESSVTVLGLQAILVS